LSLTRITVDGDRVGLRHGQLRAQRTGNRGGWVRIGLLATTALLLGGDEVEIEVSVGAGARLDLFDIAGTVAYHGRGHPAFWHVRIDVADRAELRYRGEPFVVSDGAEVRRTLRVDLAETACLQLRETLILGRSGESGGRLRSETGLRIGDVDVWLEDQLLDPDGGRRDPGMLGDRRVLDSMIMVGDEAVAAPPGAVGYALMHGRGIVIRYLGVDLVASPLPGLWLPEPLRRDS
jgi:urease accessory protein